MLGRFQITNNDAGRLTSNITLEILQSNIDKLPNGMFWYEVTSGATAIYTNNEVRRNANILVFVRGDSRCAIMFPYATKTIYVMYRFGVGGEWSGFYKYGSEDFADITTVNELITTVTNLSATVTTNTGNITTNTNDIASVKNRLSIIESSYNPYTMGTSSIGINTPNITKLVTNPNEYPNFTINSGFVGLNNSLCSLSLRVEVNNTITPGSGSYLVGHLVSALQTAQSINYVTPIYSNEGKLAYVIISGGTAIAIKPVDTIESSDYFDINITYPLYYSYKYVYDALNT